MTHHLLLLLAVFIGAAYARHYGQQAKTSVERWAQAKKMAAEKKETQVPDADESAKELND